MNLPEMFTIREVKAETPVTKTIIFSGSVEHSPGQFIMLWMPGVDEKPFAISFSDKKTFGITIEKKGEYTERLHSLSPGHKLGIRGPFGNGFKIQKEDSCIVAGGLGMAPALALAKVLKNVPVIQGARTKELMLYHKSNYHDMIESKRIIYCTDDGSLGSKCFVTDQLEQKLKQKEVSHVYTCGPEIMIEKVFALCERYHVGCQASLERFMKCGIGICGSCCIDDQLVCKDGPVFSSSQLRKLTELGKFARLKTGKKVALKQYFSNGAF